MAETVLRMGSVGGFMRFLVSLLASSIYPPATLYYTTSTPGRLLGLTRGSFPILALLERRANPDSLLKTGSNERGFRNGEPIHSWLLLNVAGKGLLV